MPSPGTIEGPQLGGAWCSAADTEAVPEADVCGLSVVFHRKLKKWHFGVFEFSRKNYCLFSVRCCGLSAGCCIQH